MTPANQGLVYNGPYEITLTDLPDPTPADGEVVVEVLAVGVCGSDVHGFSGDTGRRSLGGVMGHELVGRVLSGNLIGEIVVVNPVIGCGHCSNCQVGNTHHCPQRRVLGVDPNMVGGFARRIAIPESALFPFATPDSIEVGALVEPIAVGLHAVRRLAIGAGNTVAVIGSGMIGLAVVWSALSEGADRVFVSDYEPQRLRVAETMGAIPVDLGFTSMGEVISQLLGQSEVDFAVDAVGTGATLTEAVSLVGPNGGVCLVGMASPVIELAAYEVVTEEKSVVGSWCYSASDFEDAKSAVVGGQVPTHLMIDQRVSLDEAPEAIERLGRGSLTSIKTVILPNGPF